MTMNVIDIPVKMVCNNCEKITQGHIEITIADRVDDGGRIRIEGEAVCQECDFGQEFREVNFVYNTVILEDKDND